MFDDVQKEVIPSGIMFNDATVEITFVELKDQSERAGLMKTLVMERARFSVQVEELIDDLVDLIDAGLLEIRSPAPTLDPRRRIGQRKVDSVEDDVDSEPEG